MEAQKSPKKTWFMPVWRRLSRIVCDIFYARFEIAGHLDLPRDRGIILVANHVNALVDPVIVQASCPRYIRPLARSGLWKKLWLRFLLDWVGAVPIFRKNDHPDGDTSGNAGSFNQVYALLKQNQVVIIFPEGQSHSDPHLHQLKTGAARLALGARARNGVAPLLIPVGLNFSDKGKFRSDLLVNYGAPISLEMDEGVSETMGVRKLTRRIHQALAAVTLNADSWEDVELASRLEEFFAFRRGKYHQRNLAQKFRSLKFLMKTQKALRSHDDNRVRSLISQLKGFEKICQTCGISDYHLGVKYKPTLIALFFLRSLGLFLVIFPVMLWALFNSFIPYQLTSLVATRLAAGKDQFDTAKIIFGTTFFLLFWGVQCWLVMRYFGGGWALLYFFSLWLSAAMLLRNRGEFSRFKDSFKVFFLFLRKRDLKQYLLDKRRAIEFELAQLVKIARRLPVEDSA